MDQDLPINRLITDPKGKAILLNGTLAKAEHAATAMQEHLDREIQVVHFFHPDADIHLVVDTFGFTPARSGSGVGKALSLPERAAVAALADYFSRYRPGLRTDKPLALPRILQDESAIADGYIYDFIDEERAYMLADVCGELFDVDAEVVDDSNGWTVVIHDEDADTIGAEKLAELQGICRLLQDFTITSAPMAERTEAPELRRSGRGKTAVQWDALNQALTGIQEQLSRIEAHTAKPEKPRTRTARSAS